MKRGAALIAFAALGALAACGAKKTEQHAEAQTPTCPPMPARDYVWIPGATFTMGADATLPEEAPAREVTVKGFWMATHEVTNAEFAEFVKPYTLDYAAEKSGVSKERLQQIAELYADPDTKDARWKGKALPDEAQWELAAATGGARRDVPVDANGKPTANYYQGVFPVRDLGTDGFKSRAPVACFPADKHGVHDLIGNVWEWTASAIDPDRNVIKGGSFLCAANYCARYRAAARQFQERSLGTDHVGIRLIDTARPPPPDEKPHEG